VQNYQQEPPWLPRVMSVHVAEYASMSKPSALHSGAVDVSPRDLPQNTRCSGLCHCNHAITYSLATLSDLPNVALCALPCICSGAGGTRCFSSSGSAVPWHNCKAAPSALHYSRPGVRTAVLFSFPSSLHGFSASACATAAQAETDVDDVVSQVMTCAAVNNKETGILAQVSPVASSTV